MNRWVSAVFMAVLQTLLLVGCAEHIVDDEPAPIAVQGVLDLREWDIEEDGPIWVDGEWGFDWQQLILADRAAQTRPTGYIDVPGSWSSDITIEQSAQSDTPQTDNILQGQGYATYHLSILLSRDDIEDDLDERTSDISDTIDNNSKQNGVGERQKIEITSGLSSELSPISPIIPEIDTVSPASVVYAFKMKSMNAAYRMWINNHEVSARGQVGTSRETETPHTLRHLVIFEVHSPTTQLDITVRLSNYHHRRGNFGELQFGTVEQLQTQTQRAQMWDAFLIGSLFIMGIYQLILYLVGLILVNSDERSSLFLSIFCFSVALRILVTGESLLWQHFLPYIWAVDLRIEYLNFYTLPLLLLLFFDALYPRESSRWLLRGVYLAVGIYSLITLVTPVWIFTQLLTLYQILILVFSAGSLAVLVKALYAKRQAAWLVMSGTLVVILAAINDILGSNELIRTWTMAPLSIFAFILIQSGVLSVRFAHAFRTIERLSQQLLHLDKRKDEFMTNTSQALATPLGDIIGIAEVLLDSENYPENSPDRDIWGESGDNSGDKWVQRGTILSRTSELASESDKIVTNYAESHPAISDKNRQSLQLIVASSYRLASLLNNMNDYVKLQDEELDLQVKPVDMHVTTEFILQAVQPIVGDKPIELHNKTASTLPLVEADENRVQQILYNLLDSAIKYTEEGEVSVSARVSENRITGTGTSAMEIMVSDTGIGMSEQEIKTIFSTTPQAVDIHNTRINETRVMPPQGITQLGLTMTRHLIELHGGTLKVNAKVGQGTKFVFSLPLCAAQAVTSTITTANGASPTEATILSNTSMIDAGTNSDIRAIHYSNQRPEEPTSVSLNGADSHTYRILIVDDDWVSLQITAHYLERQYHVTKAQSASEALDALDINSATTTGISNPPPFDLIILDVIMPRLSGYEICRQIRTRFSARDLPIILIGPNNQANEQVAGFEVGASDYLTKPLVRKELLTRITTHLHLKELMVANLRLEAELEIPRQLQRMLLPTQEELNNIDTLEIAAHMEPAEEVGGDYYDVLQHNDTIKIGIGDVTGHGLESSVFTVMTQMGIRTLLTSGVRDPVHFLDTLNRTIYNNVDRLGSDKNLTLALLDYKDGWVHLSGQHEHVIIARAPENQQSNQQGNQQSNQQGNQPEQAGQSNQHRIELIDTIDLGFPIGLDEQITEFIDQTDIRLQSGDGIVLYTDGIIEMENPMGEHYGLSRLCKLLLTVWGSTAEEIKNAIVADVHRHRAHQEMFDDMTLLVLKQK
ncbi:MAG: SpoIIE family protein phosphatase [Chloroflexota bacterium]